MSKGVPSISVDTFYSHVSSYPDPLVMFTSGFNVNGDLWFPDCRLSEPVVKRLAAEHGAKLVLCNVGSMEFWKNKDHPFRHDKKLKLDAIPTLMKWSTEMNEPKHRLDGKIMETCRNVDDVENVVKPFLSLK